MDVNSLPHQDQVISLAQRTLTPIIDPTTVDSAPIRIALPRVHLAGSDAHYDAHIMVGRHGLSLFLTPTAPYPTIDIDGTREELARVAQDLTSALTT